MRSHCRHLALLSIVLLCACYRSHRLSDDSSVDAGPDSPSSMDAGRDVDASRDAARPEVAVEVRDASLLVEIDGPVRTSPEFLLWIDNPLPTAATVVLLEASADPFDPADGEPVFRIPFRMESEVLVVERGASDVFSFADTLEPGPGTWPVYNDLCTRSPRVRVRAVVMVNGAERREVVGEGPVRCESR